MYSVYVIEPAANGRDQDQDPPDLGLTIIASQTGVRGYVLHQSSVSSVTGILLGFCCTAHHVTIPTPNEVPPDNTYEALDIHMIENVENMWEI
jgi:hypothetical protein